MFIADSGRGINVALVGSLGYITGQPPVSNFVGPYLPDMAEPLVSFALILAFLRVRRPKRVVGFGTAIDEGAVRAHTRRG